jgi:peroxiredoxin
MDSQLPRIDKKIALESYVDPESKIPIEELYKDGPVILFCLRSASCFMCRKMAKLMMDSRNGFEQYGVRLFCILKERVGADEFAKEYWDFNPSTILLDDQFDLYRILGFLKLM